jgi:formate dehydrogenase major subunit
MSFHGLGVTEHTQGTFTVMLISDLAMITGNIGRPGVGVNPLRGQNNVQGAADMGCQPHQGAGYLSAYDPEINKQYEAFYKTQIPLGKGLKIPEMFDASINGKLKALWLMGEDVVQTDPNTLKVIKAMEQLDLLVVQELVHDRNSQIRNRNSSRSFILRKKWYLYQWRKTDPKGAKSRRTIAWY